MAPSTYFIGFDDGTYSLRYAPTPELAREQAKQACKQYPNSSVHVGNTILQVGKIREDCL